jgi:hypothetical protein
MTSRWWLFGSKPAAGLPIINIDLGFKMPWWKRKIAEWVFDSEWE